jgi:transcriptional regulator with XRE-family HTH domain
MQTMTLTLGDRIKRARVALGFSQEDLADAVKISRQAVAQWESGKCEPDPWHLKVIAGVLRVTVTFLATGKGAMPLPKAAPPSGYRRDMITRMQRLIDTGRFDELIERRMKQRIREGKFDDVLLARFIDGGLFESLVRQGKFNNQLRTLGWYRKI